jgi:uncharacterized protein YcgL (UPF0745 family)
MYLYLDSDRKLDTLPGTLLTAFGQPQLALTLALSPERRLARADAAAVLAALDERGYYLQLPPAEDGEREPLP